MTQLPKRTWNGC